MASSPAGDDGVVVTTGLRLSGQTDRSLVSCKGASGRYVIVTDLNGDDLPFSSVEVFRNPGGACLRWPCKAAQAILQPSISDIHPPWQQAANTAGKV